ncbi:MAG: protein kinase [Deltaproteobacteria bacterium]|nr:protein kinase [Deltaproteobacteria bacterium]
MRPASPRPLPGPSDVSKPIEASTPISGAVVRRTVQAIRPEEVARVSIGEAGLVLGDKYRLDGPIASGGMASIWAATHVTLDRPVAVKFVDARIVTDHDERLGRFFREAKVAASVRHKNVVDILDFGVHGEGDDAEPYMVMELLEGEPLDARMARAALDTHEIVRVVSQVLSGLDAVHASGIVHRDLKPANVFITEDVDGTFARVIDFGISQGVGDAHDGIVIGTPEYMSPEQAFGDPMDLRSDLYSVGVMLYEMLAGYLPFDAPDRRNVLALVVASKPLALLHARPDVPGLCAVVEKAMSRRAHDRFASAREMQAALLAAVQAPDTAHEPVDTDPPPSELGVEESQATLDAPLVPASTQPRTVLAALGAVAFAFVLAGVTWGVWHGATRAPEPERSVPATMAATTRVPEPEVTADVARARETEEIAAPVVEAPLAIEAQPAVMPMSPTETRRARRRPQASARSGAPASRSLGIQRELDF